MNKKDKIEKILDKYSSKKYIKGLGFNIYDSKSNESILQTKGNIKKDSQFFIASTTKLFTSAIIIQLIEEGSIAYSTKIVDILDSTTIHGLNVLNNKDYSNEITIKHLLAHTSGLPNYFSEHRYFAKSLEQQLISNIDTKYTFEDTIKWSKKFKPKFKAHRIRLIIQTLIISFWVELLNYYLAKVLSKILTSELYLSLGLKILIYILT